jgi:GNAT superfamily N-acetyltransferase
LGEQQDFLVMVVEPLSATHLEGFRALFEACASGCFCRYWHFAGTKNEWLERCALRPEENFAEQTDAVRQNMDSARGVIARDGDMVVGWMKVTPAHALPKLAQLPVYKHRHAAEGTWTVGCFLVRESERRSGVARALLEGAEALVRASGGTFIEGHPRRSEAPLYDEEAWQGPERLFVALGFVVVHDELPYPVYRKSLTG